MDSSCEKMIIKNFFVKGYHERVIFELNSKKKRLDAFHRLCHNYENVLVNKYMEEYDGSNYLEVYSILKSYGATDSCYVMSYNSLIDGRYMGLEEALEVVVGFGMPSLIVCDPNKLAYFEAEQVQGAPPRYILRSNV